MLELVESHRKEIYQYKTMNGATVEIVFEDGHFSKATFPFSSNYTRKQWKILSEIDEEISRLESKMPESSTKMEGE